MPDKSGSIHCRDCPAWKKSVFRDFSDADLDRLQARKISLEVDRGAKFNRRGEPVDGAHCVARGNLKITWPGEGQKESIVKIVAPGDMTGYRCLFSETHFRATAVALDTVNACFIPKDEFHAMIDSNTQFARELLRRMGAEIAAAERSLHSFCQRNVRERLADALLVLKDSCGVEREGRWVLDIILTREEISSWVGTAKETVVRTLSDFREENLLAQVGSHMVLLDLKALARVAGIRS